MTLQAIFNAGRVRRWHMNPHMSRFGDFNDAHQGRVARILMALHPNPSAVLLCAALTHDDGEHAVGDVSSPVKKANLMFADMLEGMERNAVNQIWGCVPVTKLSPDNLAWLEFADRLDALMWVQHMNPAELANGWEPVIQKLRDFAREQDILHLLEGIL